MDEIPLLDEDRRIDRIWRFIAIIFMAHARILDVWQEGESIMVIKREAGRADVAGISRVLRVGPSTGGHDVASVGYG
ncbi:MAG: hypothetical protein JXQ75_10730, partial [Phycisphaerae bacterium]|nr:hypothetical protein [Phycisphaerae bacterium]